MGVLEASIVNLTDNARNMARLTNSVGHGFGEGAVHQALKNKFRLLGHIDSLIAKHPRGADIRHRVASRVSIARRMRDNDSINIDRPLG